MRASGSGSRKKAQIALEFMVMYSLVLVVFVLLFALVASQRAVTLSQQEYSLLQLQAQNIATYIDQALAAGSGYAATIPLSASVGVRSYNLSISTSGVVILQQQIGTSKISAYAFSNARNLVINGTQTASGEGIRVYLVPMARGSISIANSGGTIYVGGQQPSTSDLVGSMTITEYSAEQGVMRAHLALGNGANAISAPIGIVTSNGTLGPNGKSVVDYTDAVGDYYFLIASSTSTLQLIADVTINAFNNNLTSVGNLISWWPLNEGAGDVAYDLSSRYNDGDIANPLWAPSVNRSNFAVAVFNGGSSYINTSAPATTSQIQTSTAWILTPTPSGTNMYILDQGENNNWMQVHDDGIRAGGSGVYCDSSVKLSPNTWYFITHVYDGVNHLVYVNGVLACSVVAAGQTPTSFDIGRYGGDGYYFDGLLSNIQIYNTPLTPSQVMQLYREGVSGIPIGNAGLAGWWPMAGDANDYSSNNNDGMSSDTTFENAEYINSIASKAAKVTNFAGSTYIQMQQPSSVSIDTAMTVTAWINTRSNSGSIIGNLDGYDGYAFMVQPSGNDAVLDVIVGGVDYGAPAKLPIGGLSFVAFTTEAGGNVIMYQNGQSYDLGEAPSSISFTSNPLVIGVSPIDRGSLYFNGTISDLKVYNTALTPMQIRQAYMQGPAIPRKINMSVDITVINE